MKHPSNRAERRHERNRVISNRRFIYEQVWRMQRFNKEPFTEWGKYSKWNLGWGCKQCHYLKYFGYKRKRREQLKRFDIDIEVDTL